MTATTPLEQALVAWTRERDPNDRQPQIDDAVALNETGVFSIRQIIMITGLPETFTYQLLDKSNKLGGKFNPEALPTLHEMWMEWHQGHTCNRRLLAFVIQRGVSVTMIERLVGIPQATVYRWLEEER